MPAKAWARDVVVLKNIKGIISNLFGRCKRLSHIPVPAAEPILPLVAARLNGQNSELLNAVWGPDIHVEPRVVDVHIRRVRKAINAEGELDLIRAVRAAGYALDADQV